MTLSSFAAVFEASEAIEVRVMVRSVYEAGAHRSGTARAQSRQGSAQTARPGAVGRPALTAASYVICHTRIVSFRDGPYPRAFAHRGWHTDELAGLENTLPAFTRAVAEGFKYLETDVHATSDGVLVAFHDAVLDRVTDSHGPVADLPYREVRRALIGGQEPIPTLDEVLDACPEAYLNIDPKSDRAVQPLLELLERRRAWDRVCIGSFSDRRLTTIRRASPPELATSLGPRAAAKLFVGGRIGGHRGTISAVAAQLPVRMRGVSVVTSRLVRAAHRSGLEVHAWTVDDQATMERLLEIGVDGIMTDRPEVLRQVLQNRGVW
ncbi:MAG: glycerophosphodiester phosphodiesterase [Nakamurella sp.]